MESKRRGSQSGLFLLSFCTVAFVLSFRPLSAGSSETTNNISPTPIAAGSSVQGEIAGATSHEFAIPVEQSKVLRFTIEKGDLSLSSGLYDSTGSKLMEQVSHEFEVVEFAFPIDVTGTYKIVIRSLENSEDRQKYELHVQSLTAATERDRLDSEARQAFASAELLRATWSQDSLRKAIPEYEKAAQIWFSASDFANASRASLKSGDVYFVLSEYGESLERYQHALKLAGRGNDLIRVRTLSHMGFLQSYLGKNDRAEQTVTKALGLLEHSSSHSDAIATNVYGELISNLAEVRYAKGDLVQALKQFERARKLLQNDRKGEAKIHLFSGYIAGSIGEPEKAVKEITQALNLYRRVNNKRGEGLAQTALGLSYSLKRDENQAIKLHREAIDIFHFIGDRHSEAIALNALGQAYENLSEYSIALDNYKKALRLFQATAALDGASVTTFKIARTYRLSGNPEKALEFYERCLSLSRRAGKIRTEANALNDIAIVYVSEGRYQLAAKQYGKLEQFYRTIGDGRGQVTALNAYGDLLLHLGRTHQALDVYRRALPLSEKIGDKGMLTSTLYNLARANLANGSYEAALSFIKRSLSEIEDVRTNVETPDLRASYFSGMRKHYELSIDILMRLHRLRPEADFATEALLLSERARARSLLDLVNESRSNLVQGAPKELLEREGELRGLLRSQARYAMDLSLAEAHSSDIEAVTNQIAQLRAEYQEVLAQLRERNPPLSSVAHSTVLDLKQIQNELGDGNTMLLEYTLGEERSYLWAVTANSVHSYELPSRDTIENAARESYKLITAPEASDGDRDYRTDLASATNLYFDKVGALSQMLLGPVADQLGNRKILLVAEGALQYVPFGALPAPHSQQVPHPQLLIETNEISSTPSVSTLVAIRSERNRSGSRSDSQRKIAAVIADPVFTYRDDRMPLQLQSSTIGSAVLDPVDNPDLQSSGLARLTHSSQEADAILAAAPIGTTFLAKGFEATPETVNAVVGQYQILHFATHGFVDSKHPELSGIVLSMVDRKGVQRNGLMSLRDIYNLDLSAELTVLSACQTALGKDIKGEGLVGLTHSFMSAGSKSVVASLWKVDDRATTTLMTYFYDALLRDGMPTGAALRAAKLKMKQDKGWSAPYYWSGFVLQGEYLNQIAVEDESWVGLKTTLPLTLFLIFLVVIILQKRKRRLIPA